MRLSRRGVVVGLAVLVVTGGATTATAAVRPPTHVTTVTIRSYTVQGGNTAELKQRTDAARYSLDPSKLPGVLTNAQAKTAPEKPPTLATPKALAPPSVCRDWIPMHGCKGAAPAPAPTSAPDVPRLPGPTAAAPSRITPFSTPEPGAAPAGWPGFTTALDVCRRVTDQNSYQGHGWPDRRSMCAVSSVFHQKILLVDGQPTKVLATMTSIYEMIALQAPNTRQIVAAVRFHNTQFTGEWLVDPVRVNGDITCTAGTPCVNQSPDQVPDDKSLWMAGPRYATRTMAIPTGGGPNVIGKASYVVTSAVLDDSPTAMTTNTVSPPKNFRCDTTSAFGAGKVQGCVFPDNTVARLVYLTTDPSVDEVAVHIWDAFNGRCCIHPVPHVPGRYDVLPQAFLHRIDDTDPQRAANSREARGWCIAGWGINYATSIPNIPQDCDEFPFASTKEGMAKPPLPNNDSSARVLNRSKNRSAGAKLLVFYKDQRILPALGTRPGDPFTVGIFSNLTSV